MMMYCKERYMENVPTTKGLQHAQDYLSSFLICNLRGTVCKTTFSTRDFYSLDKYGNQKLQDPPTYYKSSQYSPLSYLEAVSWKSNRCLLRFSSTLTPPTSGFTSMMLRSYQWTAMIAAKSTQLTVNDSASPWPALLRLRPHDLNHGHEH